MASVRQPGPVGLSAIAVPIDENTLCLVASSPPGATGMVPGDLLSWDPLFAEFERAAKSPLTKADLDEYLAALGEHHAPPGVRQRVQAAAIFFESRFLPSTFAEIVNYLQGIDFTKEVKVTKLAAVAPLGALLVQYLADQCPGNFFSRPDYAIDGLGVTIGSRRCKRFRVTSGGVDVLVSTAAPVSGDGAPRRTPPVHSPMPVPQPWQPPTRAGEWAGGGNLQVVIPNPLKMYLEPLDGPPTIS